MPATLNMQSALSFWGGRVRGVSFSGQLCFCQFNNIIYINKTIKNTLIALLKQEMGFLGRKNEV